MADYLAKGTSVYARYDGIYESGNATFSKVTEGLSGSMATAMIQQNIDAKGRIETCLPLDTPPWLKAQAKGHAKVDERKTMMLARLRAKQAAKGK
jgi:hypothetical protein